MFSFGIDPVWYYISYSIICHIYWHSAMVACERDYLKSCHAFFFNKESCSEAREFQVPLPDRWAIRRNCKILGFNAGFLPHPTQFTSYRIRKYRNSQSLLSLLFPHMFFIFKSFNLLFSGLALLSWRGKHANWKWFKQTNKQTLSDVSKYQLFFVSC